MKIWSLLFFSLLATHVHAGLSADDLQYLNGLSNSSFRTQLQQYLQRGQRTLSYNQAREVMFSTLDNKSGKVCCVYSIDHCIRTNRTPNHTIMNTEHTWPQSMGATGQAKSDLHHLFPTQNHINSRRSNFPFCEVVSVNWEEHGSVQGYSASGTLCFEPPDDHKGNVARAMFYFSVRYRREIDHAQEQYLRRWHELDPVDEAEIERDRMVQDHQRNSNLFIHHPHFVAKIQDF